MFSLHNHDFLETFRLLSDYFPSKNNRIFSYIHHLHISHNAPYSLPKILHSLCFPFLLGITAVPRKIENNAYAKFWGANKVHRWRCVSGELQQF